MNKQIHPKYFDNLEIVCACGAKLVTSGTVKGPLRVEICSRCHPFFTGEKKLVDTEGRVEKFERLVVNAEKIQATTPSKKKKKAEDVGEPVKRKSLREMLQAVK